MWQRWPGGCLFCWVKALLPYMNTPLSWVRCLISLMILIPNKAVSGLRWPHKERIQPCCSPCFGGSLRNATIYITDPHRLLSNVRVSLPHTGEVSQNPAVPNLIQSPDFQLYSLGAWGSIFNLGTQEGNSVPPSHQNHYVISPHASPPLSWHWADQ